MERAGVNCQPFFLRWGEGKSLTVLVMIKRPDTSRARACVYWGGVVVVICQLFVMTKMPITWGEGAGQMELPTIFFSLSKQTWETTQTCGVSFLQKIP